MPPKGSQKHAFEEFSDLLKEDRLPSLLLFYGKEDYLMDWALSSLEEAYIRPATASLDMARLDGAKPDLAALTAACETLPFASRKRLVVLDGLSIQTGKGERSFSAEEQAQLIDYLPTLPEDLCLVIRAGALDKRSALYKAIAKHGKALDFDALPPAKLKSFIKKRIRKGGKVITDQALQLFIDLSGYLDKESGCTLYNLDNDCQKLMAHADGSEIGTEDVEALFSGSLENNVFLLLDALSAHEKSRAFSLLHQLLAGGSNHFQLLALLVSQLELMLECKELAEEGHSAAGAAEILSVHSFRVQKAMSFARAFTKEELRAGLLAAYNVDKNIKEGSLEPDLALEMLIAEL